MSETPGPGVRRALGPEKSLELKCETLGAGSGYPGGTGLDSP